MPSKLPIKLFKTSKIHYTSPILTKPTSQTPLDRGRAISTYGYHQAKSLVYSKHGAPSDVLQLHTHSIPPPHSSLLTLRTLAAPLNPSDINQIQGTYPTLPPFTTTLSTPSPSAVPGNEACFEVLAAGSRVTTVAPGDWVIPRAPGLGTWRTHLQVDEKSVLRIDKTGLTAAQVATVSVNPVTAWRLLRDFVPLQPGDWLIQNGANSGVGRAVIQLSKLWGFNNIAVVRARPPAEAAALATELEALGATKVITEETLALKTFPDLLNQWTSPNPLLLALNCTGGHFASLLTTLLTPPSASTPPSPFPEAHLITYGGMSLRPLQVPTRALIFRDLTIKGFWLSRWAERNPSLRKDTIREILELVRRGEFRMGPFVEGRWGVGREELVGFVERTMEGGRGGKGIFVF